MRKLTAAEQHANTARMESHEIAAEMVAALGPTLVAAMTGSKDRKLPTKWAKADGPTPSTDFLRRLQFGHRMWKQIESEEGAHVARQWFIGGNPVLGEVTPLTAIREDRLQEVAAAVMGFLSDAADT